MTISYSLPQNPKIYVSIPPGFLIQYTWSGMHTTWKKNIPYTDPHAYPLKYKQYKQIYCELACFLGSEVLLLQFKPFQLIEWSTDSQSVRQSEKFKHWLQYYNKYYDNLWWFVYRMWLTKLQNLVRSANSQLVKHKTQNKKKTNFIHLLDIKLLI